MSGSPSRGAARRRADPLAPRDRVPILRANGKCIAARRRRRGANERLGAACVLLPSVAAEMRAEAFNPAFEAFAVVTIEP